MVLEVELSSSLFLNEFTEKNNILRGGKIIMVMMVIVIAIIKVFYNILFFVDDVFSKLSVVGVDVFDLSRIIKITINKFW